MAAVFIALLVVLNFFGSQYYLAPKADQVRDPLHAWLKPSGFIGQGAGVLALAIFLFLWLYPLRKKFRWLAFTGSIAKWLDVHSLAALGLPLLVAMHAAWRFGGVIGLGFWSMMVVWASGIVGRYLYSRIPRSQAGVELTIEEIGAQRQALLQEIAQRSGLDVAAIEAALDTDPTPTDGTRPLADLPPHDLRRPAAPARGDGRCGSEIQRRRPLQRRGDMAALKEVVRLANREMALMQQSRMLGSHAEHPALLARGPPSPGHHGARRGAHPRGGGRVAGRHVVLVGGRLLHGTQWSPPRRRPLRSHAG